MANAPEPRPETVSSPDSAGGPPPAESVPIRSYALLADDIRRHYLEYYKKVFDDGVLDRRTKEFVALGAALVSGAPNCIEGHLKKCFRLGATVAEVEEVVAVTLGVAGAAVVDRADIASAAAGVDRLRLEAARRAATEEGS